MGSRSIDLAIAAARSEQVRCAQTSAVVSVSLCRTDSMCHAVRQQDTDGADGARPAKVELAIAMLLKDPNRAALCTFVRYHRYLGFRRFEFFIDDLHDGFDAPAWCASCVGRNARMLIY